MPLTEAAPDAVARIYANSLFELTREQGGQAAIEATLGELEDILELARTDAKFNEFLASRILPAATRAESLRKIFTGRSSDLTLRFLLVLNRKERLSHLAPIVAAYDLLVQEAFGRVEVDVYTASPLSGDELEAIRARLRSVLGKEPVVHPYTDGSMIGGIKLQIGDQLIDGSVQAKLRRMRDRLTNEGAASVRTKAGRILDDSASGNGVHGDGAVRRNGHAG
jgi:F-type H+-transporting ATPase subunit delta